jgi:hypothetical protein
MYILCLSLPPTNGLLYSCRRYNPVRINASTLTVDRTFEVLANHHRAYKQV